MREGNKTENLLETDRWQKKDLRGKQAKPGDEEEGG